MELTTKEYNSCDLVAVTGRIDSETSPKLQETFNDLLAKKRYNIVFDMSGVDFISSAGVWTLMETQRECKKLSRGELVIASANEKIQHSLDLAGLKHFFKIFDDMTEAVGSF
jgi:anti-sigma B factor antagonist